VLLVYEWPPFAGFNGDADRARQLIAVLDALGFTIYMAARNCVGSQVCGLKLLVYAALSY
jgi:hypothetical protein